MLAYLSEIRTRIFYVIAVYFALLLLLFSFSDQMFQLFVKPLTSILGAEEKLVATKITSPFFTPLDLSMKLAMVVTIPFICLQAWCFISPALYKREKKLFLGALLGSMLLFFTGIAFGFFIFLPVVLQILANSKPFGITLMLDMAATSTFITTVLFSLGLCFQIPLLLFMLVQLNTISLQSLKQFRSYFIVIALTIAMLMGPPDILSQLLFAIPIYLLYELGILFTSFFSISDDKSNK